MSAYLVSNKEIYLLAAASCAKKYEFPMLNETHAEAIRFYIRDLIDENLASVNERYREQQDWGADFTMWLKEDGSYDNWKMIDYCLDLIKQYSPIELIKIAHHYSYQACDSKNWQVSDAKIIVDTVIEKMIPELNGYDKAAWGVS
jgi:hypothetical protein